MLLLLLGGTLLLLLVLCRFLNAPSPSSPSMINRIDYRQSLGEQCCCCSTKVRTWNVWPPLRVRPHLEIGAAEDTHVCRHTGWRKRSASLWIKIGPLIFRYLHLIDNSNNIRSNSNNKTEQQQQTSVTLKHTVQSKEIPRYAIRKRRFALLHCSRECKQRQLWKARRARTGKAGGKIGKFKRL